MESQSDFICFYGSFLSEELGINNGGSNEINYANAEIVFTLMYQFSRRRKFNKVCCASRQGEPGLACWPVLSSPDIIVGFLRAWPQQCRFDDDQHLHSPGKDLGNTLTDLNIKRNFNMGARCIQQNSFSREKLHKRTLRQEGAGCLGHQLEQILLGPTHHGTA